MFEEFEMNQAMEAEKMSNLALTNTWTTYMYVVHVRNGLSKHHIIEAHYVVTHIIN
jgi:hypothetical protein